MSDPVTQLADLIHAAKQVVCFTGAGISTESGIPDFRSPGGMWARMPPIEFQDFIASEEMRREAWRRKLVTDRMVRAAKPNRGHRAVAHLIDAGVSPCVITQNTDGLHQLSGVPPDKVIELHGNSTYAACLDCGLRYELAPIFAAFGQNETVPVCRNCGGMVKTATISFGQRMPLNAVAQAERAAVSCACSSCWAHRWSSIRRPTCRVAKRNGATLAILNREETAQDAVADLVIHGSIGPILGAAVGIE